jgi:hypothetical protein
MSRKRKRKRREHEQEIESVLMGLGGLYSTSLHCNQMQINCSCGLLTVWLSGLHGYLDCMVIYTNQVLIFSKAALNVPKINNVHIFSRTEYMVIWTACLSTLIRSLF